VSVEETGQGSGGYACLGIVRGGKGESKTEGGGPILGAVKGNGRRW